MVFFVRMGVLRGVCFLEIDLMYFAPRAFFSAAVTPDFTSRKDLACVDNGGLG